MTHTINLRIGQTVRNFGQLAKVDSFHHTGHPILRPLYADGTRWLADAERCEAVEDEQEPCRYKDGLTTLA